jgi:hypothetical protein
MQDSLTTAETASLLQKNWGLEPSGANSWEALHAALCIRLQQMLEEDFAGLVNAMYRLDVPETQFRAALNAPDPGLIASQLADAILDRELMRAKTRLHYRQAPANENQG